MVKIGRNMQISEEKNERKIGDWVGLGEQVRCVTLEVMDFCGSSQIGKALGRSG